jgi:hypothetical protein
MPQWLRAIARGAIWRRIPWAATLQAAIWLVRHGRERLNRLTPAQRRELYDLVRTSRGRPSNLTQRQRERLRALVRKALVE